MGKAGKRKEMVKNLGGIRYVWKSKIDVCVYRRRGEQRGYYARSDRPIACYLWTHWYGQK
jgi:hypothetical protein